MSFPHLVEPVPVYAGDTAAWPGYRILSDGTPVDLSAWSDWSASWASSRTSRVLDLTVDPDGLASGRILLSATAAQSRAMSGPGRWDVSATLDGVTRTFLVGVTTYTEDVPRG